MQALGFGISNNYSGFRSYETQASLYQSYVNQEGQAEIGILRELDIVNIRQD